MARTISVDDVTRDGGVVLESCTVRLENRRQILGTGENVDVRLLGVTILRQTLIRLASNGRNRKTPSKTEGTIT